MSDIDRLIDEIRRMREDINRGGGAGPGRPHGPGPTGGGGGGGSDVEQRIRELERAALERNRRLQQSGDRTFGRLLSMMDSLTRGQGSFTTLAQVLDLVNSGLSKLAGASEKFGKIGAAASAITNLFSKFSEYEKIVIGELDKAYGIFEKISDTGMVQSFTDMRDSAEKMNLTVDDTAKLLIKHGKNLSIMGGSALEVKDRLAGVVQESDRYRESFSKLGINVEELTDLQAGYMYQMQMTGRGQITDAKVLANATASYVKELDAVAKLTGISRREQQKMNEERSRDARFQAGIAELQNKDTINTFLNTIEQRGGPAIAAGFKDIIAAQGAVTTDAARRFAAQYGDAGIQLAMAVRNGEIPIDQAYNQFRTMTVRLTAEGKELIRYVGDDIDYYRNVTEAYKIARSAEMGSIEEARKKTDQQSNSTDKVNESLAELRTNLYSAGAQFQQVLLNTTTVVGILNDGFKKTINLLGAISEGLGGRELKVPKMGTAPTPGAGTVRPPVISPIGGGPTVGIAVPAGATVTGGPTVGIPVSAGAAVTGGPSMAAAASSAATGLPLSLRTNNPGAITEGDFSRSMGSIGYQLDSAGNKVAVFPDFETGRRAAEKLFFEGRNYRNLTLSQASRRWITGSAESNVPSAQNYATEALKAVGGLDLPMSAYSAEQRAAILRAQQGWEAGAGWKDWRPSATTPVPTSGDQQPTVKQQTSSADGINQNTSTQVAILQEIEKNTRDSNDMLVRVAAQLDKLNRASA